MLYYDDIGQGTFLQRQNLMCLSTCESENRKHMWGAAQASFSRAYTSGCSLSLSSSLLWELQTEKQRPSLPISGPSSLETTNVRSHRQKKTVFLFSVVGVVTFTPCQALSDWHLDSLFSSYTPNNTKSTKKTVHKPVLLSHTSSPWVGQRCWSHTARSAPTSCCLECLQPSDDSWRQGLLHLLLFLILLGGTPVLKLTTFGEL